MYKHFFPDSIYNNFKSVNYTKFKDFDNFLFDFDNTLMPWNSDNISKKAEMFLKNLINNNKIVIIASNGKGERFHNLKKSLPEKVKLITNLKKPTTGKLKKYLQKNGLNPQESVFIGDNLITDIYVGNKLGMYAIKVKPIAFKEFWATKIYRIMEFFIYIIFKNKFKEIYEKSNSTR